MIETVSLAGRTPIPWSTKINPAWWAGNYDEPNPPADYCASDPAWLRAFYWFCRNPFHNLTNYVLGVCDRNYAVRGPDPVLINVLDDIGLVGWKWSVIRLGWLRLPYISYAGLRVRWYLGWQPTGKLSAKLNRKTDSNMPSSSNPLSEAFGFTSGQRVRMLVPCVGADHEDTEHTLQPGAIGVINSIQTFDGLQGIAFTVWIAVDETEDRGIVNVFDEADGHPGKFFEAVNAG